MIKTIHVSESKSFDINTTAWWLFVYRQQFGRDILPDLLPALEAILEAYAIVLSAAKSDDGSKTVSKAEFLINLAESELLSDAFTSVSALEVVTLYRIAWALAKNADPETPEPEAWIRSLGELPIDTVGKEIIDAVIRSTVSSKNAESLIAKMKHAISIWSK